MALKPKIVEAVGVARPSRKDPAKKIEAAMQQAIIDAQAEGITDPAVIRARIQAARIRAKAVA